MTLWKIGKYMTISTQLTNSSLVQRNDVCWPLNQGKNARIQLESRCFKKNKVVLLIKLS